MSWPALRSTLCTWFADAWSRDDVVTALNLAWVIAALDRRPDIAASVRVLLDIADDASDPPRVDPASIPKAVMRAVAIELRDLLAHPPTPSERPAAYAASLEPSTPSARSGST